MFGEEDFERKAGRLASPLLGIGIGLFLYELLSGAVVTLWPGLSAWLQFGVLLHTALGLVFIAPFAVYAWTHAWRANNSSERLMVWIGYAALAAVSLSGLTGLWAAWTAAFGELLPDVARWLHRWSSYAAAALVVYHLAKSILRLSGAALWPSSTRTLLAWAGAGCGMLVVMTLALAAAYQPTIYKDGPPAGYSFRRSGSSTRADSPAPRAAATATARSTTNGRPTPTIGPPPTSSTARLRT